MPPTNEFNPTAVWLILGGMLLVFWLIVPLSDTVAVMQNQHCLLTWAGLPGHSTGHIVELARQPVPRNSPKYRIVLQGEEEYFYFAYHGHDAWYDASIYDIPRLYSLLSARPAAESFEIEWVRFPLLVGETKIMTRIGNQTDFGECDPWQIGGLLLELTFFTVITIAVVWVAHHMFALIQENQPK